MTAPRPIVAPIGSRLRAWVLLTIMLSPITAWAQASVRVAEILEASGAVEIRRAAAAPWTTVRSGQELLGTDALRTRTRAFARVKFEAGLLWLLSAESVLQLGVAVSGGANTNTIRVRLDSGRAVATWTPDRTPVKPAAGQTARSAPRAVVETPSGEASILGTEWSLSVDDNGRTALVVLEGTVELSNALASVTVRANEAAEMRVGQPPTLLRVINPSDRVQWVADYSAQPLRFADASMGSSRAAFDRSAADAAEGRTAAAIDRLEGVAAKDAPAGVLLALTDLLIAAGDLERARAHADTGRRQYPADARFDAMLSRIALFGDRSVESRTLANEATAKDPSAVEGWLALGESARNDGDGPIARRAFQRATTANPGDARGWFGLGSVETEYEAFVPARRWLARALEIDPKGPGYRGELGTVETLANHFDAAKREFAVALADRPGDYIAMTGRALLALKEGRDADALDLLLRATLIEPRYARAHVYLGVTYYRLRRHDDAVRALRKASQLDPKDPLPYLMESAIYTDVYEPAKAMAAGRRARDLMPNLKSLNQLASTQKGAANLGNSLAFMGMEQWAQHLAQESYYPFWSGSHLFLGDRYSNAFARNSEYYQGLLTDPTVFGGSPLFQTLLPRAGNYVSADASAGKQGAFGEYATTLSANGYLNRRLPIGYAVSIRGAQARRSEPAGIRRPVSGSAAIGAAPSPRASFFATAAVVDEREELIVTRGDQVEWSKRGNNFDGGLNFRPSSTSSLAARAGSGTVHADIPLGRFIPFLSFSAKPSEIQARYTQLVTDRYELSAGIELASDRQQLGWIAFPLTADGDVDFRLDREMQSAQTFVSARLRWGRALFDANLFAAREMVAFHEPDNPNESVRRYDGRNLQPRLGVSVQLGSAVARAMYQERTRPWAAQSTLGPVATAGMPLDDDFVGPGGDQRRYRGQLDWEWSSRTFLSAFAEHQQIENREDLRLLETIVSDFQRSHVGNDAERHQRGGLSALRDIARDASRLNVAALSLLEGEPHVWSGEATSGGATVNRVVTTQVSMAAHYTFRRTAGLTAFDGREEPSAAGQMLSFVPRHLASLGATWVSPRRLYVSGEAIYRSMRFGEFSFHPTGPARAVRAADWTARIAGSWESRDKRWAVEAASTELWSEHASTTYGITVKVRR